VRERERCRVKGREGGRKQGSEGVREEKKERVGCVPDGYAVSVSF
jgi:hypothetical protein